MAVGLNLNQGMKADTSNREIEEAMKRVREAQSLISAAIEPGSECTKFWRMFSLCFGWLLGRCRTKIFGILWAIEPGGGEGHPPV